MKKAILSISLIATSFWAKAQATACTFAPLLIASGTAGPVGDDELSTATIPFTFTFTFYGTGYTSARISTNGFIWLGSTSLETGCCGG